MQGAVTETVVETVTEDVEQEEVPRLRLEGQHPGDFLEFLGNFLLGR